jgi:hypothetical protein
VRSRIDGDGRRGEASRTVRARRKAELLAKRPGERFVAREAARQRNVQDGVVGGEQERRAAAQTEAPRVMFRGFAGDSREQPMQVESRDASAGRQRRQGQPFVQMGGHKGHHGLHARERRGH